MDKKDKTCFLVTYRDPTDHGIVTLKSKTIRDSSLGLSFVALSDFIFETSSVIVDPEEEAKKLRFENIKVLHLSIYSIMSIAEVGDHPQKLEFKNDRSNLLVLRTEKEEAPRL